MSTTGQLCPIYRYKIILNVKNVFDNHFMRNIKPYEEYSNLNGNDTATPAGNQKKKNKSTSHENIFVVYYEVTK